MTVQDAIAAAEAILPGEAAPDGEEDPRWRAIIVVSEFIRSDPEAVWTFIEKWGRHSDDDLRAAVATCLLEHLLEHHFENYIDRVEQLALTNEFFADTVSRCSAFGRTEDGHNQTRFDNLQRRTSNRRRLRGQLG